MLVQDFHPIHSLELSIQSFKTLSINPTRILTRRSIVADRSCKASVSGHKEQNDDFGSPTLCLCIALLTMMVVDLDGIPGVGEFDKVAIISNNRWEWAAIATAAFSMNATIVPMYEAQLPADWTYILNDSRSCAVVCASQQIYERLHREVLPSTPAVHAVLCLDAAPGEPHAFSTAMTTAGDGDFEGKLIMPPSPLDLADLIYTSGTTGRPKGKYFLLNSDDG